MTTKHLKPVPNEKNLVRYRDRPDGDVVDVEIEYVKGFSPRSRGLYLFVRPGEVGPGTYATVLMSGHRTRICTLERSSPALLRKLAEAADERVPHVAAEFRAGAEQGKAAFDELAAALTDVALRELVPARATT
jgi:hypothetical protein